jgi:hypothetical protein
MRNLVLAVAIGLTALLVGGPAAAVVAVAVVAPAVAALAAAEPDARRGRG